MSNSLDKNHPFRTSINFEPERSTALGQSSQPTVREQTAERQEEKDSYTTSILRAFLKLKPKTRIIVLIFVGGSICYGYVLLYDAIFGTTMEQPIQMSQGFSFSTADDESVGQIHPSWIQRTFCKGVKRSFLCD